MAEYITLTYPTKSKMVCDSLKEAVGALDELGLCMNWGILNKMKNGFTVLLYEGWVLRQSHERFVNLPFSSDSPDFGSLFEDLLRKIFIPFLKDTEVHRSCIQVKPDKKNKNNFLVHLFLVLGNDQAHEETFSVLQGVADSWEKTESTVFWLD